MNDEIVTKMVVSVSEMAKKVGLSRARFYQLVKSGVFPQPDREPITGRPCFGEEKQRACLEVRRRNLGVNGVPILFYARRQVTKNPTLPKPKLEAPRGDVKALLDGLNSLGLPTATAAEIERVMAELYPAGTTGLDRGQVLRAVFLEIRRRNSAGSVER